MLQYGSAYNAAQQWGPGAQATSQGTWVPKNDGTTGYTFMQHGASAGVYGGGGGGYDPTTAGGGMYGSQYGATGVPGQQAPPSSGPLSIDYSGRQGFGGNGAVAPPNGMVYNQSPAAGAAAQNTMQWSPQAGSGPNYVTPPTSPGYGATPSGTPVMNPNLQGPVGTTDGRQEIWNAQYGGGAPSPAASGPADSTLMNLLSQYMPNQQQQAPMTPPQYQTQGMDPSVMSLLQQFMGQTGTGLDFGLGAAAPAPATAPPTMALPEGYTTVSGPGGALIRPPSAQSQLDAAAAQAGGWVQNADGNWTSPTAGILTSTAANVQQPTQYANGQNAASTNPLGGMVPFPLPNGSGAGGSLGVPLPTPTPLPNIPAAPPAPTPTAPWNQPGQAGGGAMPQAVPTQQAPSVQQQIQEAQGLSNQAMYQLQNLGVDTSQMAQFQPYEAPATPQAATMAQTQPQFNFGGGTTTPAQGTQPAAGSGGQLPAGAGNISSSLLALLGGLPQPPDLTMQMPTIGTDGAFANMPGGVPTRLNPAPIITDQQMNQMLNRATGNNARQAATQQEAAREAMTGNGFSAASGALGDVNRLIDAQRMNADTQAYSQIPMNAAQVNNQSMLQQMGLNLQGQQNAIGSFNSMADFLKNQGALGAQGYGLGIQGYNAYQNALGNLLGLGNQQQQNQIAQYGQDLNAYNLQNQAQNQYLQALLSSGQLALQGNNSYNQNLTNLLGVLNQAQGNQNQELATLLGMFGGLM